MPQYFSAQFVCPSPKVGYHWKRLHRASVVRAFVKQRKESTYPIGMSFFTTKFELALVVVLRLLKFIYPEMATNFCKITTVDLFYVVLVKFGMEILQNFVAFSEYMNFSHTFLVKYHKMGKNTMLFYYNCIK